MTDVVNRQILLASRPNGAPTPDNFSLVESAIPVPGDGEFLCRIVYTSIDPYMRGRMSDAKSYTAPTGIGDVMGGGSVGQVVASRVDGFAAGDFVLTYNGWQEYAVNGPKGVRKLDPAAAPISTALGVLGMPGMTAYSGLLEIGKPADGETLVAAAASGPVGGTVGQIAKIKGCRAVGVAGGAEKCAFVTDELGFDACIDHRAADFPERLAAACPDGIDVYFENVSGHVFDAVFPLLNPFARIPVCGLIARYNATELPPGPDRLPMLFRDVLTKKLTIRGFIVTDFHARQADFLRDVGQWIGEGRIRYREDIVEGLENTPDAFIGLLGGGNFGKLLVRLAPDPTR